MRRPVIARSFCCVALCTRVVFAAPEGDFEEEEAPPEAATGAWEPRVGEGRPFSVGLEAYGGLSLLLTHGPDDQARALGGGLLRLSYWYLQAGATLEASNSGEATALNAPEQEKWAAAGGFAGVLIPFHRWIDVESTIGVVSRTYSNGSRIYGGGAGFEETAPSITWRAGISARSGQGLFGARVGSGFFGSVDMVTHDPVWQRTFHIPGGETLTYSGTTPIGGVSFGFYLSVGLEVTAPRGRQR